LQPDEHDDIGSSFLRLEGFGVGIDQSDEFIEDGLSVSTSRRQGMGVTF
jgi:hypothetical protein